MVSGVVAVVSTGDKAAAAGGPDGKVSVWQVNLISEATRSGPLSLAPVSVKSSKNERFKVFFELFC